MSNFLWGNYLNKFSLRFPLQDLNTHTSRLLLLLPIIGVAIITLFGTWLHSIIFLLCCGFLMLLYFKLDLATLMFLMFIPVMRLPGGLTPYVENFKYIVGLTILLVWFIKKLSLKETARYAVLKNPFNLFVVGFSLLAIISTIYSTDVKWSFEMLTQRVLFSFLFLYFFIDIIRGKSYLNKIITALLFTGTVLGLLAMLQYAIIQFQILQGLGKFIMPLSHQGYVPLLEEGTFRIGAYRSVGSFFHPNLLGIYLAMCLPIAVSLFVYEDKKNRWYLGVPILFMLGGLVTSGSRGALLNFLIAFCVLFIVNRRNKKMLIFALSMVLIGSLLFLMYPEIVKEFLRLRAGIPFRRTVWLNAMEMFKKHPLRGWGLGTFAHHYILRYGLVSVMEPERILYEMTLIGKAAYLKSFLQGTFAAHNIYISYAVQMGFLGVISILYFYLIYFKKVFHLLNRIACKYSKALLAGFVAAVLGNMVHGFFESLTIFGPISIGIPFFLIVAMTVSLERPDISI